MNEADNSGGEFVDGISRDGSGIGGVGAFRSREHLCVAPENDAWMVFIS